MQDPVNITTTPQWDELTSLPTPAHLRDLFAADPGRAARYLVSVGDLRIDYSKQRVDDAVLAALFDVARAAGVEARRDALFGGEAINVTEDRAVLHPALRAPVDAVMGPRRDGTAVDNVVPAVHEVLGRMGAFAARVRSGAWVGATGQRIRTVVNIGIGGSDLGPAMAYRALIAFKHPAIECR